MQRCTWGETDRQGDRDRQTDRQGDRKRQTDRQGDRDRVNSPIMACTRTVSWVRRISVFFRLKHKDSLELETGIG